MRQKFFEKFKLVQYYQISEAQKLLLLCRVKSCEFFPFFILKILLTLLVKLKMKQENFSTRKEDKNFLNFLI